MGHTPYGGADIGECLEVISRIRRTDASLWYEEWLRAATRVHAAADRSAAVGQSISARDAYFRASNYYRTAGLFLMGAPVDERLAWSHRNQTETFRSAAALLERPPEIVDIPYENTSLPAYFFRCSDDDGRRPTVILSDGYDGTVEELYFSSAVAGLARGYNVLAYDGPGQGSMIIDRGIPFRPDWEAVVTPVVDYLVTRSDVDTARIAIMGWSFGGYLAPRAATVEHRLAACISDCGPYDLYDATVTRIPGILAGQLPDGNGVALALLDRVMRGMLGKASAGWALRRNLLVHGVDDPLAFVRLSAEYSLKGRESMIRCPTYVCAAEGDDLSSRAKTFFDALTCEKHYDWFTTAEGAGDHCEVTARTLFNQRAFDWLDGVLQPEGTTHDA